MTTRVPSSGGAARSRGIGRVLAPVLAALTVLAAIAPPGARAQSAPPIYELDRIVAVVNDDVIVWSELLGRLRTVRAQLQQSGTPPPPDRVLERQVLDRLVLDRIQLQLAARAGLEVEEAALNRAIADIARRNNLSLGEFRNVLERDGYDFARFREEIRDEILITRVRQRIVGGRVTVSQRDIENHLARAQQRGGGANEYHLGHILVSIPEGASPEQIAEARAETADIARELADGAEFARIAVARSDGQQALRGGDIGWRKASALPTAFARLVPTMREGEVSEPVRSPSGFHIIKLIATRGGDRHVVTQTNARHILIAPDELNTEEEVRARLSSLRERVVNGQDMGELARAHSADTNSAVRGGDLGWIAPGSVLPEFQAQLDALQPGEVSEPFRTQYGWHIVRVEARREQDSTDAVRRANAEKEIRNRKMDEEFQSWLRQIRDEAYVEYRLGEG